MKNVAAALTDELRERAKGYSVRITRFADSIPNTKEAQQIARQLIQSGSSVSGKLLESFSATSKAEFDEKVTSALHELDESLHWLQTLVASNMMVPAKLAPLYQETNELIASVVSLVTGKKRNE